MTLHKHDYTSVSFAILVSVVCLVYSLSTIHNCSLYFLQQLWLQNLKDSRAS